MSEEKYVPKSRLGQWFDSRLPLLTLAHHINDYPTPKNLNYWWTFGGILTFFLIIASFKEISVSKFSGVSTILRTL